MSDVPTGLHRYWPYPTRAVICPSASHRRPQTWTGGPSGGPSAEQFRTTHTPRWRGSITNQHPTLYPSADSSTMPRSAQALGHHPTRFLSGVRQAVAYQVPRGSSGAQIPFNPQHSVNVGPVYPPQSGGPRPFHLNHNTPMANVPDVPRQSLAESHAALAAQNTHQVPHQGITGWHPYAQSLGTCALQSGTLQAAIPPQQLSPKQDLSNPSIVTQPSQPASVLYFEDASSTSSSVREEGSKEIVEICPFPKCQKVCSRPQELERHVWERHLPPHRYCGQPDCNFTGSRSYLLKGHHADKHPDVPEQDGFIYDAKVLAKQVRTEEIGIEKAVHKARTLFEEKGKQEGKVWCWPGTNGLI